MTAPTTNPHEAWARERKVTDLTNALLRGHTSELAGGDFVAVVTAALASAKAYGATEWRALHEATGRQGSPSELTIAAVLERLEGMLPTQDRRSANR